MTFFSAIRDKLIMMKIYFNRSQSYTSIANTSMIFVILLTTLKDKGITTNEVAFLICMLPAYVYILFYAVKGYAIGKKASS